MYAKHFIDQPVNDQCLQTWGKWHDHVDKHLAHLSIARITNTRPWTGDDIKEILEGFRRLWRDFYSKLKPDVRSAFDTEIANMQRQFPDVPLAMATPTAESV